MVSKVSMTDMTAVAVTMTTIIPRLVVEWDHFLRRSCCWCLVTVLILLLLLLLLLVFALWPTPVFLRRLIDDVPILIDCCCKKGRSRWIYFMRNNDMKCTFSFDSLFYIKFYFQISCAVPYTVWSIYYGTFTYWYMVLLPYSLLLCVSSLLHVDTAPITFDGELHVELITPLLCSFLAWFAFPFAFTHHLEM